MSLKSFNDPALDAILDIMKILTDVKLDSMSQLHEVRKVIYKFSLELKSEVNKNEK